MLRFVCAKLKHRASPFPISHGCSFSTAIEKPTSEVSSCTDRKSLTVVYLQESCGLSLESAIKASKKLRIEPTHHNPDSVLSLLRTYGLTQTHIESLIAKRPVLLVADVESKVEPNLKLFKSLGFSGTSLANMVSKEPRVLESNAKTAFEFFRNRGFSENDIAAWIMKFPALFLYGSEKTFKPKIEFFKSVGFSDAEMTTILSNTPYVLHRSLENHIVPSLSTLRRFLGSDENARKAIMGNYRVLEYNLEKVLEPNISLLRSHGVPESLIVKIFMIQPKTLLLRSSRVSEIIENVKHLGFDPNSLLFVLAVRTMAAMSKELWEEKLETFRTLGFSRDETYAAFKVQPMCMLTSLKKIHKLMDFFVNELNMKPFMISKYPNLLLLSLEKRIIPRCSVLQLLLSHGLMKEDINLPSMFQMTEKKFVQRILNKYEQLVPDVVKANKGKIEFQGFPVPVSM